MDHVSKSRRRDSRIQSPTESSADELAAGSGHEDAERRRTSWNVQGFTPQRPYKREHRMSSESSDELAVDADEYWRGSRNRRPRSPSPVGRPDEMSSHGDRSEDELAEEEITNASEIRRRGTEDEISDRSPTPMPPPAPPKPERLNYKEKFVLKGHLRGASAVQFSPDCSMIASGGMSPLDNHLYNH